MRDGYRKIFWGVFIATFNITLGMVKILPAFVGWMVVASGIRLLNDKRESVNYGTTKTISHVLVAITLVGGLLNFFGGINISSHFTLLLYPLIVMVIELILLHRIFEDSVQRLGNLENYSASNVYIGKDRTYIILSGISIVLIAVTLFLNLDTLSFFAGILALVTRIYLLTALNSLSKEDWDSAHEREEDDYDPEHSVV